MTVTIRDAGVHDHGAFVRLFGELGVPDPVPGSARFADGIVGQMRVACAGEDVIGYVTWRAYGPLAHVIQLVVAPSHRGQRIGAQLLEAVRAEAVRAGCTRWYLNVKRDNLAAQRLYARCGFAFELESFAMVIAWARVPALEVRAALATPADDAAIAAQFPIASVARLASFRARAAYRLVLLRDAAGAILGFAAFDPSHPGAATFCARDATHAPALLAAIRRHADPAFAFVRISVEGDRPLAEAVLGLGAELTFEILRLSAAL